MNATDATTPQRPPLPNGLVAVVKRDCPTCELVAPVLGELDGVAVISQDDPAFPDTVDAVIDDTDLTISWHHNIETVPTLIRVENGEETERIVGWDRTQWQDFTGTDGLGAELPDYRPGCGSLSVDPTIAPGLEVRLGGTGLHASRVEFATLEDPNEAMYERGWSDGLPLVAPTIERVQRMLTGTTREANDVVTVVPPDLIECSVEKVAINAVMAGCKPEYLPVVLAALEAVCTDEFNIHGVMATTMGAAPIFIVNGPIRHAIGLNSGLGALGPGPRANSTIGRAVMLTIRNVGGARPGGVDRSTHGNFGKIGRCFAELEESSPWEPLSTTFGHAAGTNTVTAYCGAGSTTIVDQLSREPDSLARTLAAHVQAMRHPKLVMAFDALLVISPEHARVFEAAGWDRAQVVEAISDHTKRHGSELQRGVGGMAEGIPFELDAELPKTRPGGLRIMHAGSGAGLFSTLFPGWVSGEGGSEPVTREITP